MLGIAIAVTAVAGAGGTGLGGACACCFRRDSARTVSLLLSFAAGVMMGVVCFDLLADAVNSAGRLLPVVVGVLAGYGAIGGLNTWVDRRTAGTRTGGSNFFWAGVVMAAAIALHNVPEGMVIGASFAGADGEMARGGWLLAVVIGLHNVPEGMAVTVPLLSGGMGRLRAVAVAAATGLPTVVGAVAGYALGTMGPMTLSVALSVASGGMLYVVFGELLPESTALWKGRLPALAAVLGVLAGLCIVYL